MRFRCLAVLSVLAATTLPAHPHPLLQNAMWVRFEENRVRVAVNVSVREIIVAQNLAPVGDGRTLALAAERHGDYVVQHLTISANGNALTGKVMQVTAPMTLNDTEKTWFQYELEYPFRESAPARVSLRHDMLREWFYAAGTPWDITYEVSLRSARSETVSTALLVRQQWTEFPTGWEATAIPAAASPPSENSRTFREYLWHGVMHILSGWDHLLFVTALVIATVNFWDLAKVIAAFTLAHTITLTLSVFDIIRLPSWIVEPAIALSIIFVALENIFFPRRAHSRLRLLVAFGFGLIHGLGFAGGLLDAMEGLPRIGIWIALAAFSLGVEIGHQIVVVPIFGALAAGRKELQERLTQPVLRYGSSIISLCGAYYLCVAVHEQFFAR